MYLYGSKDSKYLKTSKLHDFFKSYSNFNDQKCMITHLIKKKNHITPIFKGWMSNRSITTDSLEKKKWKNIGLRICNFVSEMVKNCRAEKKLILGSLQLIIDGSRSSKISSSILLCILGELAGGGSRAVAVCGK